jgi:hypothetical protein
MLDRVTDYASFQPAIGLLSRYAIHKHLHGASNFYEELVFTSMP